jgi:hypothetical protein
MVSLSLAPLSSHTNLAPSSTRPGRPVSPPSPVHSIRPSSSINSNHLPLLPDRPTYPTFYLHPVRSVFPFLTRFQKSTYCIHLDDNCAIQVSREKRIFFPTCLPNNFLFLSFRPLTFTAPLAFRQLPLRTTHDTPYKEPDPTLFVLQKAAKNQLRALAYIHFQLFRRCSYTSGD